MRGAHGHSLDAHGRRLGSRPAGRGLGRRRRDRRRAPVPRDHELERGAAHAGGGRSPSGRAGSASGAGSSSARSPARTSSSARGRASSCSWTRSRRGSCSRRESAAGATTGTRSSSASRPTCRGRSRSTRRTARGYELDATFQPTFLYEFIWDVLFVGVLILIGWRFTHQAAGALRPVRDVVHGVPRVRGDAADRPGARLPRPAAQLLGLGRPLRALDRLLHLVAVHPQGRRTRSVEPGRSSRKARRWRFPAAASGAAARLRGVSVRELELDLEAFEGPFDLLLTLVLKEEVPLADVDVAGIVLAFVEQLAEREQLDLEACGEFLVLVSSLLELKARGAGCGRGRRSRGARSGGGGRGAGAPAGGVPALQGGRRTGWPSGWPRSATGTSGSGRRRSRRSSSPAGGPGAGVARDGAARCSRSSRRRSRSRTWRSASRRSRSLPRALPRAARRRRRFDFEQEVAGSPSSSRRSPSSRCSSCGSAARSRSRRPRRSHRFECPGRGGDPGRA